MDFLMARNKRPVFLNLMQIHLPVTAWVSIAHRLSGLLLAFIMPIMIFPIGYSLVSVENFEHVRQILAQHCVLRMGLHILALTYLYHVFAGVRHLIMDCNIGLSRQAGKYSAWALIILFTPILFSVMYHLAFQEC